MSRLTSKINSSFSMIAALIISLIWNAIQQYQIFQTVVIVRMLVLHLWVLKAQQSTQCSPKYKINRQERIIDFDQQDQQIIRQSFKLNLVKSNQQQRWVFYLPFLIRFIFLSKTQQQAHQRHHPISNHNDSRDKSTNYVHSYIEDLSMALSNCPLWVSFLKSCCRLFCQQQIYNMKLIVLILALIALALAAECPHDLEVLCIDDINKAYPVCDKAAKEKGSDVVADLNCMKYFASMGSDCWPCICWVAQINKWKVKGC